MINNRGFLLDYYIDRIAIDNQGQTIEDWLDLQGPDVIIIEETMKNGYVYTDMINHVNNGNGTKWPIETRQPQGTRDKGGKRVRIQAMGARFENQQAKVPGIVSDGRVILDPRWSPFIGQWRTFPSGHDDLLDACYWAQYEAFAGAVASGGSYEPYKEEEKEF